MADKIPNTPTGAVPPKKETGKVQPKKETVRINLPPKPSAAPTIKLPTLPPGGSTGAPSGVAPAPAAAPAPGHPAAAAPAAPRLGTAAPVAQRPSSIPHRTAAPVAAAPALSQLDSGLAIGAAILGVLALGSTLYLAYMVLQ